MQSEAGAQLSACSCRRGRRVRVRLPLCSSAARRGRLLAPSRPPINRSICVASGCFRSQNRCCGRWPLATRAKGGQRQQKPDLGYILATYFLSASVSMERVKGIEPSSQAWEARILPLNHTRICFPHPIRRITFCKDSLGRCASLTALFFPQLLF